MCDVVFVYKAEPPPFDFSGSDLSELKFSIFACWSEMLELSQVSLKEIKSYWDTVVALYKSKGGREGENFVLRYDGSLV